jgi:hypothetical protein
MEEGAKSSDIGRREERGKVGL